MKIFHLIMISVLATSLIEPHIDNMSALAYNTSSMPVSTINLDSPLKQFKSGITLNNIQCKTNFTLIIKVEDGSPACVYPSDASKLIMLGWAKQKIDTLESHVHSNPIVKVVSIQVIQQPTNPGGPTIQLTLMNAGVMPITSLKATLDLNNNYTFNFKDVTASKPLISNHSVSNVEILIGGGFTTESTYLLTISGTTDNGTFSNTVRAHIT